MTQKEMLLLMSYIYNIRNQAEQEVRQLQKNIRFRAVDTVDCAELSAAITRFDTISEMTRDILAILNLDNLDK